MESANLVSAMDRRPFVTREHNDAWRRRQHEPAFTPALPVDGLAVANPEKGLYQDHVRMALFEQIKSLQDQYNALTTASGSAAAVERIEVAMNIETLTKQLGREPVSGPGSV